MRFLLEHGGEGSLDELVGLALAAHAAGLDGILVHELVAAAAVSSRVDEVLVAAEVELGRRHPVEVAEEAAVVDLIAGGRLVLVARPAPGAEETFAEHLDVVRHALAPRPFLRSQCYECGQRRLVAILRHRFERIDSAAHGASSPILVGCCCCERLDVFGAHLAEQAAHAMHHLGRFLRPALEFIDSRCGARAPNSTERKQRIVLQWPIQSTGRGDPIDRVDRSMPA